MDEFGVRFEKEKYYFLLPSVIKDEILQISVESTFEYRENYRKCLSQCLYHMLHTDKLVNRN